MLLIKIFNEIANVSSTNEKIKLLEKQKDNELFCKILEYMYSPYKQYHVKKYTPLPRDANSIGNINFEEELFVLLDKLDERIITGNFALETIANILSYFSSDIEDIFNRILKHDARCGISTALINKAIPKLIPVIPYQRCREYEEMKIKWKEGVYVQKKEDGSFWYLNLNKNKFISRNGNTFDSTSFYSNKVTHSNFILVGELLIMDKETGQILPREIGNGIINSIYQENNINVCPPQYKLHYSYWDILTVEEFENLKSDIIYEERMYRINKDYLPDNITFVPTHFFNSCEEAQKLYQSYIEKGWEGVVIKSANSLWKNGTAKDIFKRKNFCDVDLRVIGFNEGTGKYKNQLGSIIFATEDKQLQVNVSGFNDEQRKQIWETQDDYLNTIWTVKANGLLKGKNNDTYSLFLPAIVEQRFDKNMADTIQRIKDIFKNG